MLAATEDQRAVKKYKPDDDQHAHQIHLMVSFWSDAGLLTL